MHYPSSPRTSPTGPPISHSPPQVPALSSPKPKYSGGTAAEIAKHLLTSSGSADTKYMRYFLLGYRPIINGPSELWNILNQVLAAESQQSPPKAASLRRSICNLLKEWLDVDLKGLRRARLLPEVLQFAERCLSKDEMNRFKLLVIRRAHLDRTSRRHLNRKFPIPAFDPTNAPQIPNFDGLRIMTSEGAVKLNLIAEQLTLFEHDLMLGIQPREFFGKGWQTPDRDVRAPHLVALSHHFNFVSYWVATEIMMAGPDVEAQAEVIRCFLRLAERCSEINNFNALAAIIAGLNNGAVQRLHRVWASVGEKPREVFLRFDEFLSPHQNYAQYRNRLRAVSGVQPVVPYLPVLLRDATYINDGNPDYLDAAKTQINLDKQLLIGQCYDSLRASLEKPYPYLLHGSTLRQLHSMSPWTEDELYARSEVFEPKKIASMQSIDAIRIESLLASDPSLWSNDEVCAWLRHVGFGEFMAPFNTARITGRELLALDHATLSGLGIVKLGERKRLLKAIAALAGGDQLHPSSPDDESSDHQKLTMDTSTGSTFAEDTEDIEFRLWNEEDVVQWARAIIDESEASHLRTVNGSQLLELEDNTLCALGVSKIGSRKRLLREIEVLRGSRPSSRGSSRAGSRGSSRASSGSNSPAGSRSESVDAMAFSPVWWNEADVGKWLDSINLGMYRPTFEKAKIKGEKLLVMTDKDFSDLGVKLGHKKRLLKALNALQEAHVSD